MKSEASVLKNWWQSSKRFDILFVILVIGMTLFGLLMVYSASFIWADEKAQDGYFYIRRQAWNAICGLAGFFALSRVPFRFFRLGALPFFLFSTGLLAAVFIPGIGVSAGGARRWIHLGVHFQPSECVKVASVLYAAYFLSARKYLWVLGFLPVIGLLMVQPDFGSIVQLGVVLMIMFFVSGVPLRYFLAYATVGGILGGVLAVAKQYRRARLIAFLDPWRDPGGKGFQILQSYLGLYNGGLFGLGLGNSKQKLFFLPEAHNDFLGAIIAEELGFVGLLVIDSAYVLFVLCGCFFGARLLQTHREKDRHFGFLVAIGIASLIGFRGFFNLAVIVGLVPTKGLTLPLLSYGGSSLCLDLLALGVLWNIARISRKC